MDEPLDPPDGKERLVDGVADTHIADAVFRCTFFAKQKTAGEIRHVEVVRMAIPVSELPEIIQAFVACLADTIRSAAKQIMN